MKRSDLSEAEYIEAMEEMKQEILREPDGALVMVNVAGIDMSKAVAHLFGRGVHFVDTVDQAKDWLVREDEKRRQCGRPSRASL